MFQARWTREEDMKFEQALIAYPDGNPDFAAIARILPEKTPEQVAEHFADLVHDVEEIEAGRIQPPNYDNFPGSWESSEVRAENQISFGGGKPKSDPDRKKGTPWTEEEHRLFLLGLQQYGKGDWRSISRNFVVTRTATQVASHAQKYYLRQGSGKRERKRSSIHDITSADTSAPRPPQQNTCLFSHHPIPNHIQPPHHKPYQPSPEFINHHRPQADYPNYRFLM